MALNRKKKLPPLFILNPVRRRFLLLGRHVDLFLARSIMKPTTFFQTVLKKCGVCLCIDRIGESR